MRLSVLLFASLADRAGSRAVEIDVDPGDDVAALWNRLVESHPALGTLRARPAVACDGDWADWGSPLTGVREVAFLPPFSGG